jgi:hypothetical protein
MKQQELWKNFTLIKGTSNFIEWDLKFTESLSQILKIKMINKDAINKIEVLIRQISIRFNKLAIFDKRNIYVDNLYVEYKKKNCDYTKTEVLIKK